MPTAPAPSAGLWDSMDTRPEKETDPALRRSQSGFSTKIRILADRRGHPLCLRVTDDPRHDSTQA